MGKAVRNLRVLVEHPGHLRLLEHELRDEDLVGVVGAAPGQVAPVAAVELPNLCHEQSELRLTGTKV